eukprot:TRINITY_DN33378_c0_g1_i1.p1 TRINITY_DN33378_c0_g1~~TRINITY_DN33378_c0_g1_i1.p1  ORF type:complete len:288 (+),score=68.75 TRINITY_DN33378_c0_g1_i1:60-923(+)
MKLHEFTLEEERTSRWGIPLLLTATGMLYQDAARWFTTFLGCYAVIFGGICLGCGITIALGRIGKMERCQPGRGGLYDLLKEELIELALSCYVSTALAAWPVSMYLDGQETACTMSLEEASMGTGSWWVIAAKMVVVIFGADCYLYWKHRFLHSRYFYVFHKGHHQFYNPTPFAGFAVSPGESLVTFLPVLGFCVTHFKFYAPVHLPGISTFILLNFYLHAGYNVPMLEKLLPYLFINTSKFHNLHHEKTHTHFGEMLTLWDRITGTDVGYLDLKDGWTVVPPQKSD